jgi:hypothetical protein
MATMQTAKQLSVSLVNKPGRLHAVLAALQKEKVNILALTVMDSGERSTLRFVPDDAALAASAMDTLNVRYDTADVLMVEVANQSGAFAKVCERLAAEHLNIDYAYSSFGAPRKQKGGAMAIVKVNDMAKASRALSGDAVSHRNGRTTLRRRPQVRRAASWKSE